MAAKNQHAWDAALKMADNRDYTLRTLASANHMMLEAKAGNNAEMQRLQRFVPSYFTTLKEWLAQRIKGFGIPR